MRNYIKVAFYWPSVTMLDSQDPSNPFDFRNQFVAWDEDEVRALLLESIAFWYPAPRYSIVNITGDVESLWMELSKRNLMKMFRLLNLGMSTQSVTCWDGSTWGFPGAVPTSWLFTLFVGKSPKKSWSKGK